MNLRQHCATNARRQAVAESKKTIGGLEINGVDYVEVLHSEAPDEALVQRLLDVVFLKPDGVLNLGVDNFVVEGGERIREIRVLDVQAGAGDRTLRVLLDRAGDFSRYRLRLKEAAPNSDDPPANMDRILSCVDFSFKVECGADFDCLPAAPPPVPEGPGPKLDYLARDYASFRQLMLDRMAATLPEWTERSAADLGVTLVEALAYAADHTSYYQDAVSTEAYLPLARRRVSVRRHARLLGYRLHDGSNARAFIAIAAKANRTGVKPDQPVLPAGTKLATRPRSASGLPTGAFTEAAFEEMRDASVVVFETMEPVWDVRVARNAIPLYAWGETRCCLPAGATSAHLVGTVAGLGLKRGDVVILEELIPYGGTKDDPADPSHRQAVRLSVDPIELTDTLEDTVVTEIHWRSEDALDFAINLSGDGAVPGAVALGNVVLADHGERVQASLSEEPKPRGGPVPSHRLPRPSPYRPQLLSGTGALIGLTHAAPHDPLASRGEPAVRALRTDPMEADPSVTLVRNGEPWRPRPDLLRSDRFANEFVVETTDEGAAWLRFGDNDFGRRPEAGSFDRVAARVGNGTGGNVGADSIGVLVTVDPATFEGVRNPLPAVGGTSPASLTSARIRAPRAFFEQRRAVTPEDYSRVVEGHPEVQRAVTERRWTGSWHVMFVAVDRVGGGAVDAELERTLMRRLEEHRLAGHDVEIVPPTEVPLDVSLVVCVDSGYDAATVNARLLDAFSSGYTSDGSPGFFHPDNFTFGTPVHLSRLIARAMRVTGVQWIGLSQEGVEEQGRFRRLYDQAVDFGDDGVLPIGPREVAVLENDPNAPERGRLSFVMEGGR